MKGQCNAERNREKKRNNVRTPSSQTEERVRREKIYDEISRNCHKNSQLSHVNQGERLEFKV